MNKIAHKPFKIFIIIAVLLPIVIFFGCVLFVAYLELTPVIDKPFKPEIEHGEFPFKLVYEINGKSIVIEDAVICDYEGIAKYGGLTERKWETTLKSENEQVVLLDLKDADEKTPDGQTILRLIFNVGNANYYMDDDSRHQSSAQSLEKILFVRVDSYGNERIDSMSVEEAYDSYGIKLISWECASPIENSFKEFDNGPHGKVSYVLAVIALVFVGIATKSIFKLKT